MKNAIKYQLSRIGILPYLNFVRSLPQIIKWIHSGCHGVAPTPVKQMVIASYLQRFNLCQFIETGTHLGDTLAYIAHDKSVLCASIELANIYYHEAIKRFASYGNVTLHQGDSGALLPKLIRALSLPALFWLDGHYSGGNTGCGDVDTPVGAELQAILDSPIKTHVVLIDDARYFNGASSYPYLDALLNKVRVNGFYDIEISADIIRITPKAYSR